MVTTIIEVLYFFLPAYVANTFACILGKGRPLDLGKRFYYDGRRILGDGVTIRGSLAGILCGTVVGFIMAYFENPLFPFARFQEKIFLGFLLSFGAISGDAVGSFIKRRSGIKKGDPAPILDQLNFVVGGLLFARLIAPISLETIVILMVLTPFGHLMVNVLGYILKMKDVPW